MIVTAHTLFLWLLLPRPSHLTRKHPYNERARRWTTDPPSLQCSYSGHSEDQTHEPDHLSLVCNEGCSRLGKPKKTCQPHLWAFICMYNDDGPWVVALYSFKANKSIPHNWLSSTCRHLDRHPYCLTKHQSHIGYNAIPHTNNFNEHDCAKIYRKDAWL